MSTGMRQQIDVQNVMKDFILINNQTNVKVVLFQNLFIFLEVVLLVQKELFMIQWNLVVKHAKKEAIMIEI